MLRHVCQGGSKLHFSLIQKHKRVVEGKQTDRIDSGLASLPDRQVLEEASACSLPLNDIFLLQWAERRLEGGATEQWGDKWEEDFSHGKGSKKVSQSPFIVQDRADIPKAFLRKQGVANSLSFGITGFPDGV